LPETGFRLWDFSEPDDHQQGLHRYRSDNMRPRNLLDPNDNTNNNDDYEVATVKTDRTVYMELGKLGPDGEYTLTPYDRSS
jgi:hypothetical protein